LRDIRLQKEPILRHLSISGTLLALISFVNILLWRFIMKLMDKIEVVVQLKEKIAEAKKSNKELAMRLEKLLEQVLTSNANARAI